jgi:hypothetical protein
MAVRKDAVQKDDGGVAVGTVEGGRAMKYNPLIVTAWMVQVGIPAPTYEYAFHPVRKWRFDIAWPTALVYLEVDGGIWISGGHNRGAQILKDWEKRNTASGFGWRGLWCQPKDLCTDAMARQIKNAINSTGDQQ